VKGTVIRRGSKWAVVVDLGRDGDGNRIRKWHSGFGTKRDAETARIEILARLQHGEYVAPNKVTVGEWFADWLEGRVGLAETTLEGYERDARRVTTRIGHMRLRDVSTATLNRLYRELEQSLAPATVKNTHAVTHKAFKDGVKQGLLAKNPAEHVELRRPDSATPQTWTASELTRFLGHVRGHRLGVAWRLMCLTGMRRSEVLGLRWSNVALDAGSVAVVDTLVPVKGKPVLRADETKTRRSRRVVGLDTATVTALKVHRRRQAKERLRAGEAWAELDLVFTNEIGDPVNPATFTRWTARLAIEAGVPRLTPHDAARHGWATLALTAGIAPKVVQERLGHSSIAMTMDRYSHVIEGMDRAAAETVAALVEHTSG
jgi:integrase